MASVFQTQLVRYGNDHNILHIHDNILPIYSKTWVSKSVISLLLLGRIITGNNNSDLLHVNNVLHLSPSIHGPPHNVPPPPPPPPGFSLGNGSSIWWRLSAGSWASLKVTHRGFCSFYIELGTPQAPHPRKGPVAKGIFGPQRSLPALCCFEWSPPLFSPFLFLLFPSWQVWRGLWREETHPEVFVHWGAQKTDWVIAYLNSVSSRHTALCRTIERFLNPGSLEIVLPLKAWECSQLACGQDQWHMLAFRSTSISLYSKPLRLALILHFLFPTCALQSGEKGKGKKKWRKILWT